MSRFRPINFSDDNRVIVMLICLGIHVVQFASVTDHNFSFCSCNWFDCWQVDCPISLVRVSRFPMLLGKITCIQMVWVAALAQYRTFTK